MLRLTQQIWRLLDAAQKRSCILVVCVSTIAGCFTVIGVAGIAPFFAVLSEPAAIDRYAALAWFHQLLEFPSAADFAVYLGLGFVMLVLLSNLANFIATLAIGRFSHHVGARLHVLLFREYLSRDLRFHSENNSAELATYVVNEVNRTVAGVVQGGLTLITGAVAITLIVGAVVLVDPVIALGAALLLGVSYALVYSLVRRRLIQNGTTTTQLWAKRAKVITESFTAIKDVIVFRAQAGMSKQVAHHSEEIATAQASTSAIAVSPRYVLECVTAAGLVASALWIYARVGPGQWLTHLAFLGLAAYRLLPAVQQVFTAVARIRSERAAFERIAGDLRRARRRESQPPSATLDDEWRGRPRKGIRLANVTYRHAAERAGGVDNISLYIPAGALVGFVGPNGSGKTTLAHLILGLLKPDTGSIEIDGVPLDDKNRDAWLSAVAHVPQDIVLLDATVARNVALGVAPPDIDPKRLREAVEGARLNKLIDAMPDGLETVIGENGAHLSGGQRQRIGIARAFYRSASLLVMDEAASSLDSETESEVFAVLATERSKCTTILIAHRGSALRGCDLLFELDGGRIVRSVRPSLPVEAQGRFAGNKC